MKLPRWGIRFARPAASAGGLRLIDGPLPEQLVIPLNQSMGVAAKPLVTVGSRVLRGQPIGAAHADKLSATVHASASGTVTDISVLPVTGRQPGTCITIAADETDELWPGYPPISDPLNLAPEDLRQAVADAGIVGLGGALFPTASKLATNKQIETLLLNGVECEPRISCDDALMQSAATEILKGAQIMLRIVGAAHCIVVLKDDSPAIDTMAAAVAALDDQQISLRTVPTIYPAGGEIQLTELITGIEVPGSGLPIDAGILCQNVATAAALHTFLASGEPLISRIVSITGGGVKAPVDVRARIGTPISALIACAGGYTDTAQRLVMGGPMMGIALPDDRLPITKACNSIYVAAYTELPATTQPMPCIRCGDCATACPVNLMPQLLLQARHTSDYERLDALGLSDCIECGCCDYVCPSQIPLTRKFVVAKQQLREINSNHERATSAEQSYDAHVERLQRRANDDASALEDVADDPETKLAALLSRTGINNGDDKKDGHS